MSQNPFYIFYPHLIYNLGEKEKRESVIIISYAMQGKNVKVAVQDNGVGIPEHHMDKIFEPFFTTKINGQGIGIGLSMARRIVEKDFGGLIVAKSEGGRGSSFKISLPMRKQT